MAFHIFIVCKWMVTICYKLFFCGFYGGVHYKFVWLWFTIRLHVWGAIQIFTNVFKINTIWWEWFCYYLLCTLRSQELRYNDNNIQFTYAHVLTTSLSNLCVKLNLKTKFYSKKVHSVNFTHSFTAYIVSKSAYWCTIVKLRINDFFYS